jgi:hypothetical protein
VSINKSSGTPKTRLVEFWVAILAALRKFRFSNSNLAETNVKKTGISKEKRNYRGGGRIKM